MPRTESLEAPRLEAASRRGLWALPLVLGLMVGLHVYIGVRLFVAPQWPAFWAGLGWTLLWLLFLAMPLGMVLRRLHGRGPAAEALLGVAYFWMGAFAFVLTALVATDLARWALETFRELPARFSPQLIARTQAAGAAAIALLLIGLARRTALGPAALERVRVPVERLPPALEGLRLVQLSDIHIGDQLGQEFLDGVVERVNALVPDLVLITGDLADGTAQELREEVAPLGRLRARLGVFYVTGNHEYYWGGPDWEDEVRRLGITVLHNEHRVLGLGDEAVVVAGITDRAGAMAGPSHRPRLDLALQGVPEDAPCILLAHQPRAGVAAAPQGVDLVLCGHTHGGQIFPFSPFVRLQQPFVKGLKKVGATWIYTHRGTGFWGPAMRLGSSAEIAELTLVREG